MPPTTTFPAPVFAALTPAPYLHAHLTQTPPTRPSGRSPTTARTPILNVSSLTHATGSAVIRAGDTAIVVGVRAEILDVDDVPLNSTSSTTRDSNDTPINAPSSSSTSGARRARDLIDILLVPNVEFATGCSADQIPGAAPSSVAQSTAFLVKDLLLALDVVDTSQLEIWGVRHLATAASDADERMASSSSSSSAAGETDEAEKDSAYESDNGSSTGANGGSSKKEIVGYFVLYIDCIILSLAGTPLPPLWLAILAALRSTVLPRAHYSTTIDAVVCDPAQARARRLVTNGVPIAAGYRVFEAALHKGLRSAASDGNDGSSWVLADADAFEQGVCAEEVLVVVDCSSSDGNVDDVAGGIADEAEEEGMASRVRIRRIQKRGGFVVDEHVMKQIIDLARPQWDEWNGILCDL